MTRNRRSQKGGIARAAIRSGRGATGAARPSPLRRAVGRVAGPLGRFARAQDGNVAIFLGFAIVPLIGAVGLALDSGRAYLVENRLVQALDAASLAAARVSVSGGAEADARRFFDANYPDGYLSSDIVDFTYEEDAAGEFFTVSAEAQIPTTLMRLLGQETLGVSHATEVQRLTRGLELALVMDNTGSMRGGNMSDMKSAALDLVDILFGAETEMDNVWVSLVPYTATVNIGPEHSDWLKYPWRTSRFGAADWKGCVEARDVTAFGITGDESDTPPYWFYRAARFDPYFYPDDVDNAYDVNNPATIKEENWRQNEGTGPNLGCGPAITPLTNQRADVVAAIDEMQPWHRGGTASNLGMVWGWRTISPDWRGRWPGLSRAWERPEGGAVDMPLDYGRELMSKVVVLLTDGNNTFYDWGDHRPNGGRGPEGSDYTAYGRLNDWQPGFSSRDGQRELDRKLGQVCSKMKEAGVEIYSITVGRSLNTETRRLYEECASNAGQYFHAPRGGDLSNTFRTIGQQLSNLRVVR